MASKREDLLLAAKKLLWEWGYVGTSPCEFQEIARRWRRCNRSTIDNGSEAIRL